MMVYSYLVTVVLVVVVVGLMNVNDYDAVRDDVVMLVGCKRHKSLVYAKAICVALIRTDVDAGRCRGCSAVAACAAASAAGYIDCIPAASIETDVVVPNESVASSERAMSVAVAVAAVFAPAVATFAVAARAVAESESAWADCAAVVMDAATPSLPRSYADAGDRDGPRLAEVRAFAFRPSQRPCALSWSGRRLLRLRETKRTSWKQSMHQHSHEAEVLLLVRLPAAGQQRQVLPPVLKSRRRI